jgi:hypothetical protein
LHIENQLSSASGLRQIGRMNGYSYRVVRNRIQRLARQYLTLFGYALSVHSGTEDFAFDGFESYIRSQYFPTNLHILVGTDSQACYGLNVSVMRRKGRMTPHQKMMRSKIDAVWRPSRRALERSVRSLFVDMAPIIIGRNPPGSTRTLWTDEKREYSHALNSIRRIKMAICCGKLEHKTVSSRIARTRDNPLFPVNYIDREIRKDMGEHARETVKQGRELNCSMERAVVVLGAHTFRKPYRINNRVDIEKELTHAAVAGLVQHPSVKTWEEWGYTHRQTWSHFPVGAQRMTWIRTIWQRLYENPPIVQAKTGHVQKRGQPKEKWFPRHLLV